MPHARNRQIVPALESEMTRAGLGPVKALLQLNITYDNGETQSIFTSGSWKCANSPIVADDLFEGESYDARLEKPGWEMPEYDEKSEFRACQPENPPKGTMISSALLPPIRVVGDMHAREIFNPSPGVYVFDFGQNYNGWTKLLMKGPRGTTVKVRYAELLNKDNTLNPKTNEWAESTDTYVMKGGGIEEYEPRFTYHGFRFVGITGFPGTPTIDSLIGRIVHSSVEDLGGFVCSDSLLNQIHQNVRLTQLSNLMGIPTDVHRETKEWVGRGDAYMASEEAILNFGMVTFLKSG